MILDIGATDHWIEKKGKYEVERKNQKTPQEALKDFLVLARARPEILAFVDPFGPMHPEEISEMTSALADAGQYVYSTDTAPQVDADENSGGDAPPSTADTTENPTEAPSQPSSLGAVVFGGAAKSVSELAQTVLEKLNQKRSLCYSVEHADRLWTSEAMDLAVGCGAEYVHIGPLSGCGATMLDRLRTIGEELNVTPEST